MGGFCQKQYFRLIDEDQGRWGTKMQQTPEHFGAVDSPQSPDTVADNEHLGKIAPPSDPGVRSLPPKDFNAS